MPDSAGLVGALRAEGIPAVISGAGPTVLAFATEESAEKLLTFAGSGFAAHRLELDRTGASVLPLDV